MAVAESAFVASGLNRGNARCGGFVVLQWSRQGAAGVAADRAEKRNSFVAKLRGQSA